MKENLQLLNDLLKPYKTKSMNILLQYRKMYIDKLADIVSKHNNKYYSTIKMKSVDIKPRTYVNFNKENNNKDSTFKVGDHVRTLKYTNIFFQKVMFQIGLKKFLKILCRGHMLLVISMVKKLLERFIKKSCKKQVKENLEQKK